jgi:hypothetical protein
VRIFAAAGGSVCDQLCNSTSPWMREALPWVEQGMEREAMSIIVADLAHIDIFRTVHGNRRGPIPKRRPRPATLFEFDGAA